MISTATPANVIQGARFWLAAYLAGTGVILVTSGHLWLVGLHLIVIALVMRWGDLVALVVAPLLYGEIPALIAAVGTAYHDATVQAWEQAVFGTQPSQTLAGHLPYAALSELLHAGYLSYYLAIFIPPLLLLAYGERRGISQTVLALTITYVVCWAIFIAFPVQGPRYLWSAPADVPAGPIRSMATHILAAGSSRGAAFPSSHMAVTVTQAMLAWRWQRPVAWALAVVALLVGCGAVYAGFHYAVDMVVGAALGTLVSFSVLATSKR